MTAISIHVHQESKLVSRECIFIGLVRKRSEQSDLVLDGLHLGVEGGNLLADAILALLQVQASLLELERGMGSDLLLVLFHRSGILADSLVRLFVHGLHIVSVDSSLDVLAKLLLEAFIVLLMELTHIISDMSTKDMLAQNFSIKTILFLVKAREALVAVGNVNAPINGTLHGCKDLGTSGGATQSNVQERLERTGTIFFVKRGLVNTKVGQDTAGTEETSAIGGRKVGQTSLDTIVGELMSISRGEDKISLDLGIDNLADNVRVGEADD